MADKIINGSLKVTGGLVDSNNNSISVDNIPQKNANETITGSWTFSNYIKSQNISVNNMADIHLINYKSGNALRIFNSSTGTDQYNFNDTNFRPADDCIKDLGTNSLTFKDTYIKGKHYLGYPSNDYTLSERNWNIYHNQYNELVFNRTYNSQSFDLIKLNGGSIYTEDQLGSLGTMYKKWNSLYLKGKVNPNANGKGLSLPDTTSFTTDSEIIDSASAQTIIGIKTFTAPLNITFGNSTYKLDDGNFGQLYIGNSNAGILIDGGTLRTGHLAPQSNNSKDIGTSSLKYKDLYLSGNITDGTNEFNADNVFNVINASDIVNNTLTQEQYDLITNGKPTLIKGSLTTTTSLILTDLFLKPFEELSSNWSSFGLASNGYLCYVKQVLINKNTKVLNLIPKSLPITINYGKPIGLAIGEKDLPAYPTDTTKQYKLVQQVGGNLGYVEDRDDIVNLNTGIYTSGTDMSDEDYAFWSQLTGMTITEATKFLKGITFIRIDSSRNEVQSSTAVCVRADGQAFDNAWYDIKVSFGDFGSFTIYPDRLAQKKY